MIHTEDEAAMALQVSNALTQALLQYQLKNISKEVSIIISVNYPYLFNTNWSNLWILPKIYYITQDAI